MQKNKETKKNHRKNKSFPGKTKTKRLSLSKDEQLLVKLDKLAKKRGEGSEQASSLLRWYLKHHSWTESQRRLAQMLCGKDTGAKTPKTSLKKSSARRRICPIERDKNIVNKLLQSNTCKNNLFAVH